MRSPLRPCTPIPLTGTPTVKPTLVGWVGEWNSTAAANGLWQLDVFAEDVDNATGIVYSSTTYAPITVTVDNPPPGTSVVLPSNGATLSGTQYLDAVASPGVTQVHYALSGGPDNFSLQLLTFSTPTYYGWIGIGTRRRSPMALMSCKASPAMPVVSVEGVRISTSR